MENKNWNLASNTQLQEECKRLQSDYTQKQLLMKQTYEEMHSLSEQYINIKSILEKRQGKNNGSTKR